MIAVRRNGITGAEFAVASRDGKRLTLHFPTHADDFGQSVGTGTAVSTDGGSTWSAGRDDWLAPKSVGVWQERLRDDSYAALAPNRFHRVKLERMIRSWSEVVTTPEHYNQLVNAVHGVLTRYDLPDRVQLTGAEVSESTSVNHAK